MNPLPATILQSLAPPAHCYSSVFCVFISPQSPCLFASQKQRVALLYRSGSQWCEHRTHVTHGGAWQRGNEFLSQAATHAHTTAWRSIFNKESVVQKQSTGGEGGLLVYVRVHECLMRALQWARTIIRVVTKKKKKQAQYVVASTCAADGRGEDRLVILLHDHTGSFSTGTVFCVRVCLRVERGNTTIRAKQFTQSSQKQKSILKDCFRWQFGCTERSRSTETSPGCYQVATRLRAQNNTFIPVCP